MDAKKSFVLKIYYKQICVFVGRFFYMVIGLEINSLFQLYVLAETKIGFFAFAQSIACFRIKTLAHKTIQIHGSIFHTFLLFQF